MYTIILSVLFVAEFEFP